MTPSLLAFGGVIVGYLLGYAGRTFDDVRRQRTTGVEVDALRRLEAAAHEVDAHFGGSGPGRWFFDGAHLTDDTADALLSMHDYLLDVERTRFRGPPTP